MDIIKIIVVLCTMNTAPTENGPIAKCHTLEGTVPIAGKVVADFCEHTHAIWIGNIGVKENVRLESFRCFPVQSSH